MFEEKRKPRRYRVKWTPKAMQSDRSVYQITIIDVSMGGLSVYFPHSLATGTQVNVEFCVDGQCALEKIRAQTHVTFTTILSDNRGARLGLKFSKVSRSDMHFLANVLHKLGDAEG